MTDELHDDQMNEDAGEQDGRERHETRSPDEQIHDERLDALVRGLAMDYHRPPVTPREAMWTAIATGVTAERSPEATPVTPTAPVIPITQAQSFRVRRVAVIATYALAASLLVAVGVGIGVNVAGRRAAVTTIAATGRDAGSQTSPNGASETPSAARPANDSAVTTLPVPQRATQLASRNDPGERGPRSSATPNGSAPAGERSSDAATSTYQQLTTQHLAQVEALLTSFRSEDAGSAPSRANTLTPAQARAEAQITAWARDLLTDTRLLLDAPAERVAERNSPRRQLLQDLELVLAQIVQLSPSTAVDDRQLIERTLSREHVMPRLRAANPAGQASGT